MEKLLNYKGVFSPPQHLTIHTIRRFIVMASTKINMPKNCPCWFKLEQNPWAWDAIICHGVKVDRWGWRKCMTETIYGYFKKWWKYISVKEYTEEEMRDYYGEDFDEVFPDGYGN